MSTKGEGIITPGRNTSSRIPIPCPPQVLDSLKWHGRVSDLFGSSWDWPRIKPTYPSQLTALPWLTNSPLGTAGQTRPFSPPSFGPDLLQPAWMWVARREVCVTKFYFQRWLSQRHKHNDGSSRSYREVDCSTIICCNLQITRFTSPVERSWKLLSQLLTWNLIHLNCKFSAFTFINRYINH